MVPVTETLPDGTSYLPWMWHTIIASRVRGRGDAPAVTRAARPAAVELVDASLAYGRADALVRI